MSQSLTHAADSDRRRQSVARICLKAVLALAAAAIILVLTVQLSEYPI